MRMFGKSSCRHSSCERGLLLSIFDFKKKKYRTFLQDSETGADDTREYERGRGVWGKNNLQEGHGSEMSENLIRKHYWFSGRVQGVGFRYRACYIASSLGVTGWVRNNWDERVEMEAQGTREDLARMVEMLYRQSFIGIEGVEEKVVPVEVESGFYAR
ncbi:Acylphosphatase [Blautia wexlerae]|uniref:acylphosphatase n=1 Tax=Blautia wexlerae TaxID=418240 RepID=A0A174FNN1_9FIRM|nr:Acylphosphatase [Blautia wexlerae]